jgi:hypothetical protein
MIRNMITAAVLTATLATQAAAFDTFHISRHGAWEVTLTTNSDGMYCAASTVNAKNETFDVTIYPNGTLRLFLLFDGQTETAELDIDVHIKGAPAWELDQMFFTPGGAMFEFGQASNAVKFVVDLQNGTEVAISLRDQRKRYGHWSLTGSRAAIDGLFECFRRISGVGA